MSDLAEFLLARIADDEATTRTITDRYPLTGGEGWYANSDDLVVCIGTDRALAECEAKRAIVQRCVDVIASFGDWDADAANAAGGRVLWNDVNRRERAHAHDLLALLAAPYSDHPDFPAGPEGKQE